MEHDDELLQEEEDEAAELDFDDDEEGVRERKGWSGNGNNQSRSDGLSATQADMALLEAAMSSAVHHPNVVQTYHYRTLQPDAGSSFSSGRVTRVSHLPYPTQEPALSSKCRYSSILLFSSSFLVHALQRGAVRA